MRFLLIAVLTCALAMPAKATNATGSYQYDTGSGGIGFLDLTYLRLDGGNFMLGTLDMSAEIIDNVLLMNSLDISNAYGITSSTLTLSSDLYVGGQIIVIGSASFANPLFNIGGSTFVVDGGDIWMSGDVYFGDGIYISTFDSTGNLSIYGTVDGYDISVEISDMSTSTEAIQVQVNSLLAGGATTYVEIAGDYMTGQLTLMTSSLTVGGDIGASGELYVNGTNDSWLMGQVGIGTTTPNYNLDMQYADTGGVHLNMELYDAGGYSNAIYMRRSDSDTMGTMATTDDGDTLGAWVTYGVDGDSDSWHQGAGIRMVQVGVVGDDYIPTKMQFYTNSDTAENTDAIVIDEAGDVSMSGDLDVTGKVDGYDVGTEFAAVLLSTVALQSELDASQVEIADLNTSTQTHADLTGTSAHGAVATDTASQIVTRDANGDFSASSITASTGFYGDGSGLTSLTAANISAGTLETSVVASSVAVGAINNTAHLGDMSCGDNEVLQWDDGDEMWACSAAGTGDAVLESTQTFTGANTFTSSLTVQSGGRDIIFSTNAVTNSMKIDGDTGEVTFLFKQNKGSVSYPTASNFSHTSPDCVGASTVTITTTGGDVAVWFAGSGYNDTDNNVLWLNYIEDGVFPTKGIINSRGMSDLVQEDISFYYLIKDVAPGVHTYCLAGWVSASNGIIIVGASNTAQFGVEEK